MKDKTDPIVDEVFTRRENVEQAVFYGFISGLGVLIAAVITWLFVSWIVNKPAEFKEVLLYTVGMFLARAVYRYRRGRKTRPE